jgi:hypothetical protein
MQTSFVTQEVSDVVYRFAVELACAGRVFTMQQLGRHPQLSWRSQPKRRAREFLAPHRDCFEVIPWLRDKPYLWRLTEQEKRRRGIKYRNVGPSQHADHWLAIGELWMELVFHGMRPKKWFTEGKDIGRFDIFADVIGRPYLIELQLTELREYEWKEKWRRRIAWLQKQRWKEKEWAKRFSSTMPTVMLVTSHKMNLKVGRTIPKGVIVADNIDQLHHVIKRPPQ